MRIGIFGGTFNPIHFGHLLLAESARERYALDRVVFIPTHQPPHKHTRDLLPGSVRFKLIELAIRDHPSFVVSDVELERQGLSYSIDTVRILKDQLPQAKLFLLIGEDMLAVRWVQWNEIKKLCNVVVAHRAGLKRTRRDRSLQWLAMPQVEISSSDIRSRIKNGRSIRYLLPSTVEHYICANRLYAEKA